MFNKVILIGNLTKDVVVRYSSAGLAIASLRLAVKSNGDQDKEDTLFIDAVTFGKQAEICNQYLGKGDTVLVEGRLSEKSWDFEGNKRSKVEVIVKNIKFLSKRRRFEEHDLQEELVEEKTMV